MKRYSVGALGTFESEEGEWVPADDAARMYEALKGILHGHIPTTREVQRVLANADGLLDPSVPKQKDGLEVGKGDDAMNYEYLDVDLPPGMCGAAHQTWRALNRNRVLVPIGEINACLAAAVLWLRNNPDSAYLLCLNKKTA